MDITQKDYDELLKKYKDEQELNIRLITVNKRIADQNVEVLAAYQKAEAENERMKGVQKKGVFFEYDNDPNTMTYVPVLGDLTRFKNVDIGPTRLMYTFKFIDIETWVTDLHSIMKNEDKNIHKVNEEDI